MNKSSIFNWLLVFLPLFLCNCNKNEDLGHLGKYGKAIISVSDSNGDLFLDSATIYLYDSETVMLNDFKRIQYLKKIQTTSQQGLRNVAILDSLESKNYYLYALWDPHKMDFFNGRFLTFSGQNKLKISFDSISEINIKTDCTGEGSIVIYISQSINRPISNPYSSAYLYKTKQDMLNDINRVDYYKKSDIGWDGIYKILAVFGKVPPGEYWYWYNYDDKETGQKGEVTDSVVSVPCISYWGY
jgi:hypothetical protein